MVNYPLFQALSIPLAGVCQRLALLVRRVQDHRGVPLDLVREVVELAVDAGDHDAFVPFEQLAHFFELRFKALAMAAVLAFYGLCRLRLNRL